MTNNQAQTIAYATDTIGKLFLQTAVPIVIIMMVNGLYNVVDAWFLGIYVGAEALAAVTLMFPFQMIIIALSMTVSSGMSSILARALGAKDRQKAEVSFTLAHLISTIISTLTILLFTLWGADLVISMANGDALIENQSYSYMKILVWACPLMFYLTLHNDALRAEGYVKIMTLISLAGTALNILFNYILIVQMDLGVEGSAYGTVGAQALSFIVLLIFRHQQKKSLGLCSLTHTELSPIIKSIFGLGIPSGLNFLGVGLVTIIVIYALQIWPPADYSTTISAYGILTRVTTFTFLPLMGFAMATQTLVGHNFGAGHYSRSRDILMAAIKIAFIYCVSIEALFFLFAADIGRLFVDDPKVINDVTRLIPYMIIMFFSFGPMMIIAYYFQAIGSIAKAAILNLGRTYLFVIPLLFILPIYYGETGVWSARPVAEIGMWLLTLWVLKSGKRHKLVQDASDG
ncbi:MATE family efflux transporter [Temperatibacter marinus]|uniref:Multidrug export protein MepA n=1 Tax=Temperatibacter marinus TaxID=1456591 RepID=A0AA52EII3_9PROT|nr:MATE family efflux transporter [Temperatibacter marinus]WND03139.1 MATE family efflux transporter [Temperatibacter marinus]